LGGGRGETPVAPEPQKTRERRKYGSRQGTLAENHRLFSWNCGTARRRLGSVGPGKRRLNEQDFGE